MSCNLSRNEIINSFSSKIDKNNIVPISILILNTPCKGFGDIIFAFKLKRYLEKWYPFSNVKIATTKYKSFISLGENKDSLIELHSLSNIEDCRRFKHLYMNNNNNNKFDLIFVAPLQSDFESSLSDVRHLIPYANSYNTYFFSEYNDSIKKYFDFHTGIGKNRCGMFFVESSFSNKESHLFLENHNLKKNKYIVCYIAESISGSNNCFLSFFEMVIKKYKKKLNKITIIVPEWIAKNFSKYINYFIHDFSNIIVSTKSENKSYTNENKNKNISLHIRGDLFPIPNKDMLLLMKNSLDDMLLTGDQSITDALSCCPKKNIWYQIAPWKKNYANELSKLLPNKYYKNKKTSCGTIEGISLKSDYREFIKKWSFEKLAKPKITRIINMVMYNLN